MTHSQRLRFKISLADGGLERAGRALWRHPAIAALLPTYLATLYGSVRSTVPLLEMAAARATSLAGSDPLAAQIALYYERHAREELHHDEWLLADIAVLGLDRSTVRERGRSAEVRALIGRQRYWIRHAHPVSLLAWLAVLEGTPPNKAALDAIAARARIPRDALRTFYKHAVLDPGHRRDLHDLLDRLPLSPFHEELLGLAAFDAVGRLTDVIERLLGGGRRRSRAGRSAPAGALGP